MEAISRLRRRIETGLRSVLESGISSSFFRRSTGWPVADLADCALEIPSADSGFRRDTVPGPAKQ